GEEETGAWEHQAQVPVKVLRAHSSGLTSVHFCFQDSHVLSSSADSTSILWDIERCVPLRIFEGGHAAAISECAVIPNSNKMVTVSWDKKMVAWDMETGQTLWTSKLSGLLTSCSASSDGRLVVCAEDLQNGVYISDAASGQTLHRLTNHHGSTITRCRFDPQSQRIATVSADRTIKLWDLVAKKTTLSINSNHSNVISNCCFTNNGHFLCTASWDKTLQLWDLQTGTFRSQGGIRLEKGHEGSVSSCAFSTDANLLVSSSYDRTVTVWDMSALCDAYSLKGHLDWVTDVSISADKKRVASASKDGTARLWNTENLEEIPEVLEKRRSWGMGIHIVKCEECGNPLSLPRPETAELLTKCVWCRLKSPTR
ncbi:WD repeat-containing protein 88-like, partial [Myripristis murdjan]|uniref:WD repeat-containing protein 88-like n=1 Tax=Myripristis murdjan TaxID=586833 RepID=UPI0011761E79